MILVDASVWIDHIRTPQTALLGLLNNGQVLAHPSVIGEIALGYIRGRKVFLNELQKLMTSRLATDSEVLHFIESHRLFGLGIGYVDAHLLASTTLTAKCSLWTRDKRLRGVAAKLGIGAKGLV